jgi:hypothetical protein
MKYLIRTNEATPYPDGTALISKDKRREGKIKNQCGCGSGEWLHYEVVFCDGSISSYQHTEIERIFDFV